MPPEIRERALPRTAGRMVEPAEIAAVVAFLAGPGRSGQRPDDRRRRGRLAEPALARKLAQLTRHQGGLTGVIAAQPQADPPGNSSVERTAAPTKGGGGGGPHKTSLSASVVMASTRGSWAEH